MKDNCYPMNSYSINGNFIYEGCGIESNNGLYEWFYTERGEKSILKYFGNEKDAVEYAFSQIKADKYASLNFIGMFKEKAEIEQIIAELENRSVEYYKDEIPYGGLNDIRTRIFIVGCGIKKVTDLIKG